MEHGGYLGQHTILCDSVIIHLPKQDDTTQRVDPIVNYGVQLVMYQLAH